MSETSASKAGLAASIKETAMAMVVLSAVGAAVGALSVSLPSFKVEAPTSSGSGGAVQVKILELPAIVTNLSMPSDTWARFEGAIVVDQRFASDVEAQSGDINNDILAYLRTLTLAQIEGPSGFQILRQALNERLAIRTKGKVGELVIRALVVQ